MARGAQAVAIVQLTDEDSTRDGGPIAALNSNINQTRHHSEISIMITAAGPVLLAAELATVIACSSAIRRTALTMSNTNLDETICTT